ncbi:MAG: hypothetical protein WCB46_01110 [Methanoregula sp.]
MVFGILFAGCTQSSGTGPGTTAFMETTRPAAEPATHQVSLLRDIKDSDHLFSLQVPVEWNVKTYRLNVLNNPEGFVYQTDLVEGNVYYIQTFTAFRSQEQVYRDQFRHWSPSPTETTATINEIIYDRFESTSDGKTSVAYVARKSSANERGYTNVIVFVANTSHRFEKEDFEKIVASFRYFSGSDASSMPGEEITRSNPPLKPSSGSCGVCHGG